MKRILLILTSILILTPFLSKASTEFNPGFLISDQELMNHNGMTLAQIQEFLESKNSFLATYRTLNAYGQEKTAAEIIYNAAVHNYDCTGVTLSAEPTEEERTSKCRIIGTVNPKFLLVLLQKEQSLIEGKNLTERQLDWATGYGCPDSLACNPYFRGFGKQVNSAALQFRWYVLNPQRYNFKAGNTYTFNNRYGTINSRTMEVTIENNATAALYNYTPHVYNGNYNFWIIWNRYFPSQGYPSGSILKAGNDYWLIQSGEKRKFSSLSVLASRHDPAKAIEVDPGHLSFYQNGAPIRFHNYSILMAPDGKLYLLVDGKKRLFSSTESFRGLGFNPAEIMNASWQDVNSYENGLEITLATAYPTGALLQNSQTGGVYWTEENTKSPILDKIFLSTKFKDKRIIPVSEEELAKYMTVPPVLFPNGELLKSPTSPTVYLIHDGQKRSFASGEIFLGLGYGWGNIITVSDKIISLYPDGDNIEKAL